jgi:hypothetical protein
MLFTFVPFATLPLICAEYVKELFADEIPKAYQPWEFWMRLVGLSLRGECCTTERFSWDIF